MVDEFSAFSRMPRPEMKRENVAELVRQVCFLERNRNPDIRVETDIPTGEIWLRCDARQVSQALTNLLKNAAEAIAARAVVDGVAPPSGLIEVSVRTTSADEKHPSISIIVEDNGRGLPTEDRDRLTEPYVTTHVKGTGLGLAIVKKIMEDHGSELTLADRKGGGARVSMVFYSVKPTAVVSGQAVADAAAPVEPVRMSSKKDIAADA